VGVDNLKEVLVRIRRPVESPGRPVDRHANQIWCVVANVVDEHPVGESREIRRGTTHFSPGAKVYCYPPLWGDGYEKVKVIGHHRGSNKLVTLVMPSKWLENWRVKMVYSPLVIEKMQNHWDDSEESLQLATRLVESCIDWQRK
jgi:hypothetical protein